MAMGMRIGQLSGGWIFAAAIALLTGCSGGPAERERLPKPKPINLEAPIDRKTGRKLAALAKAPDLCAVSLSASSIRTVSVAPRSEGACGFGHAVAIQASHIDYSRPPTVSCPMAAALYLWERDVVGPAALKHFGMPVTLIEHWGTYSCRNQRGGRGKTISEHAFANAIDIAAFHLADGRRVTVLEGWDGRDRKARKFLKDVRDGGCQLFRGVLDPDSNRAHKNHFHFDMGRYRFCG